MSEKNTTSEFTSKNFTEVDKPDQRQIPEETKPVKDELQIAREQIALLQEQLTTVNTRFDQLQEKVEQLERKNTDLKEENSRLKETVFIDSLTGCYNENYLNNFIKENFDSQRNSHQLSVVYLDINNLKIFNDRLGHDAGDELIRNTAVYLKSIFRNEDLVIHLHGDEFVVICRNHNNDPSFSENFPLIINQRITSKTPDGFVFGDLRLNYSVAAGVAVFDQEKDGDDLKQTINRADKAMYENKKNMKSGE